MPDEPLLTLKQLANQLGLPESTVRYYRDAFLNHIPSVGTGRRRRYPPPAIAVLRSIAKLYAAGKSKSEIVRAIEQSPRTATVTTSPAKAPPTRSVQEVSNLDLLAAILDGEREQRDALWQMAKEIVRLTDVLVSQDSVLNEIADRAGVVVSGRPSLASSPPPIRLASPAAPAPAAPSAVPVVPPVSAAPAPAIVAPPLTPFGAEPVEPHAPPVPRETAPFSSSMFTGAADPSPHMYAPPPAAARVSWSSSPAPVNGDVVPSEPERPAPPVAGTGDIDKLRAELEAERALVDRLRESKVQLEHRVSDAEAALEDTHRARRPSVLKRLLGSDPEA